MHLMPLVKSFISWIVFLVILDMPLSGQLDVRKAGREDIEASQEGFFYSIPRTGIRIDIQVKKTQRIKGPYAEFSEKYLGVSQVIMLNSTEYDIESILLSTFNEPDPSEYYFVRNAGKPKHRQPLELYLSDRGALIGLSELVKPGNDQPLDKEVSSTLFRIPEVANPSMVERIDTVLRRISVDTSMIEQKVFKKVSAAKTPEQKAKEAADFILKLDESMFNLINGYQEVSYEKGTMEYMYSQMEKLRNDYMQLFKGVTGASTETYSFTYMPQKGEDNQVVTLCRFSTGKGISDKSSSTGDLVQLIVKNLNHLAQLKPLIEDRNANNENIKGLFYCIPEDAQVSVKVGGQVKIESQYTINQLGLVTYLPSSSLSEIELYHNTGGLKHVILR